VKRGLIAGVVLIAIALVLAVWLWRCDDRPRAEGGPDAGGEDFGEGGERQVPPRNVPTQRSGTGTGTGTVDTSGSVEGPSVVDQGKPWATVPATYPSESSNGTAFVNLLGEPVKLHGAGAAGESPLTREIHGRVTENGAAAPGATVVIAQRLMAIWSHLTGQAVVVADASGGFVVRVPDTAAWAIALGPRGWSRVTALAGDQVDLVLEPAAGLDVVATEDNAPFPADLSLGMDGFMAEASSPDGTFRFAALPPGTIEVRVTAQRQFATGIDHAPSRTVTLVPGKVTPLRIELSSAGAVVVAIPSLADGEEASTVEHVLLDPPAPATLDALRAASTSMNLLGGRDALNAYEHERVPAGPHVVCAVARLREDAGTRWACATVDAPASGVVEVPLPLR
jgi:hypothetical protein